MAKYIHYVRYDAAEPYHLYINTDKIEAVIERPGKMETEIYASGSDKPYVVNEFVGDVMDAIRR